MISKFFASWDAQRLASKNFDPRKVGLQIIFRLREENLYVKVGPSLQHQPAVALFMAVLGLNEQLVFHWLKISDLTQKNIWPAGPPKFSQILTQNTFFLARKTQLPDVRVGYNDLPWSPTAAAPRKINYTFSHAASAFF